MKIIMMQDQVTQAALQEAYKSRYAPRGKFASPGSGHPAAQPVGGRALSRRAGEFVN